MKIAFVSNRQYMRGVDVTSATVFELGEPLSEGDQLFDAVTGQSYEVASRGFPPKRSSASSSQLHWSREASIAFRGKCNDIEKRLLFGGDFTSIQCATFSGVVKDKTALIPSEVPIVGLVAFDGYDSPGVLLVNSELECALVTMTKRAGVYPERVNFSCLDPSNNSIELQLEVEGQPASETGQLLGWEEVDCAAAMV